MRFCGYKGIFSMAQSPESINVTWRLGTTSMPFDLYVGNIPVPYDRWAKAWFKDASTNALIAGPSVVHNAAGLENLLVYALNGGNPATADRSLVPVMRRETVNCQTYLTLTASKFPGADVTYQIQASGDLSTWGSSEPADVVTISNSATGINVRAATPVGQTNRQFLRLKNFQAGPN